MRNKIVRFLGSLKAVDELFKEYQQEEEEFSQHGNDEGKPYIREEGHHFVHTDDDSVTTEMRGY